MGSFEKGDLVIGSEQKLYVILEAEGGDYSFMYLQDETIPTLYEPTEIEKGFTATQPQSIFDKYHMLYETHHD